MSVQSIDPKTLKNWLDRGDAVLVDVREPAEYVAEHIDGSTLIPLATISSSNLPASNLKKIVIHCRKGGRGTSACENLVKEMPGRDIYNLAGGIEAWTAAGLPVCTSGHKIIPLDRQVQMCVGFCVLLASLVGYFYSPSAILVAAFLGAGLVFAGISGFCGLARVLAVMPWNDPKNTH